MIIDNLLIFNDYPGFWAFLGYFWTTDPTSKAYRFRTAGTFVSFKCTKIFLTSRSLFWAIESVGIQSLFTEKYFVER